MSGQSTGRETRSLAKKQKTNKAILGDTTTNTLPKKSLAKKNPQPETSTSTATSGPSASSLIDISLDANTDSTQAMEFTPSVNVSSLATPGISSEQTTMDVDSTPVNPSLKGKEKVDSTPLPFGNFTRRLNFTLIADFSDIPEKLSKAQQMDLIDLRCSRFSSYSNNRVGNYRGSQFHFVYLSDDEDVQTLINSETSQHETSPYLMIKFKKFDQLTIDQSIKASRSSEADRTIKATNVPPELNKQTLQEIFTKYGTIERLAIVKKDPYNIVYVVYKNGTSTTIFNDVWSIFYKKEAIRITPLKLTLEAIEERTTHVAKLTGLPLFCFATDLLEICKKLDAKNIHVSRARDDTRPSTTTYLYFESDEKLHNALVTYTKERLHYEKRPIHLVPLTEKACFACGDPSHEAKKCHMRQQHYKPIHTPMPRHLEGWDQAEPNPRTERYYGGGQNWDDHPPPRSYADAAKGSSRDSRPRDQEITELNKKFDKFSSEAIRLFESITVEFNIFKEKQKLIEAQSNLLMTKVQRIESEKHEKLEEAEEYIKTHDVDETSITAVFKIM